MLIEKLEYDGKKWIEFSLTFKIFIGLIVGLTIGLLMITAYLYKTSEQIKIDPLNYASKIYDFKQCDCVQTDGVDFHFNKTSVWHINKLEPQKFTFDMSKIKLGDEGVAE